MEVTRKQEIGLRISSICGFVLFLTSKRGVPKSIYQLKINVNDNSLVGPILVEVIRDLLFFFFFFFFPPLPPLLSNQEFVPSTGELLNIL